MKHRATQRFRELYAALPEATRAQADKQFALLKRDPRHPSLHLKRIGSIWSARVSLSVRVLGAAQGEDIVWFWIGDHPEYERLVRGVRRP